MNSSTRKLVIVIIALLIVNYLRFYLTVVKHVKIIQVSIAELSLSLLLKKNPIVLNERIVNPLNLLQTVFKYSYIFKRIQNINTSSEFTQNKARYVILSSRSDNCSVHILNPLMTQEAYVDVKLHNNMVMILPFRWFYRLPNPSQISSIHIEDTISYMFGR
jgi:hypothetical protein